MNDKTQSNPQLETVDMSTDGPAQRNMVMLVNHIGQSLAGHRKLAARSGVASQMDSSIIAALIVAAGTIHGEIVEMGMVEDDTTDTATQLMLIDNFAAGQDVGRNKVKRSRGELPKCDDPTCRACHRPTN